MNKVIRLPLFLALAFILVGCVGTVEQATAPVSDTQEPVAEKLAFTGVSRVKAISDTRVEIFFPAASGGSGKFVYDVYIGTDPVRSYSEEVLEKELGQYRLTISGLKVLSQVTVRVEARDKNIFGISNSNKIEEVTTYSTEVCQFEGIASLANMPGIAGKDQLRVQWVPANFISTNNPANPRFYEIALVQAGRVNPDGTSQISLARDQLWNKDLNTSQGRFVFQINAIDGINEYVVKGLTPDYNYHVGVRCIHAGTEDNPFFPELRGETNTKAVTLNTLNDALSSLVFDESKILVSLLPGAIGFTAADVSWAPVTGTFDHFRVYYKKKTSTASFLPITASCNTNYNPDAVSCVSESYDKLKTTLSGLTPNQLYTFQIVICQTVSCTDAGKSKVVSAVDFLTTPNIAQFAGLTKATPLYEINEIGGIQLDFIKPNLTTGYIDQYVVSFKRAMDPSFPWTPLVDEPTLSLDPYDVTTTNKLIVRGVQLGSTDPYCFKVEAKVGESTVQTNTSSDCLELSGNANNDSDFRGPTIQEFSGLLSIQVSGNRFTLYWKKPTAGFYSQYVIRVAETTSSANIFGNSTDITKIPLNSLLYESALTPTVTQMQVNFPVSTAKSYKIALTTSFPNPFTNDGDLPVVTNQCVWTCMTNGVTHTCSTQSTCPQLEFN